MAGPLVPGANVARFQGGVRGTIIAESADMIASSSVSPMSLSLTAPAAPMSLAGRAGYKFEPPTMLQGFACHGRGVELCEATPKHVRARVRSKRVHDVDLHARGGRLVVGCSCPARSFGQTVCKHVWAALLEVDRQGGLEDLHAVKGMLPVDAAPSQDTATPTAVLESEMTPRHKRPKAPRPATSPAKSASDAKTKEPDMKTAKTPTAKEEKRPKTAQKKPGRQANPSTPGAKKPKT
jgi:hypothetical protein